MDADYALESYQRRYRGLYLSRTVTRCGADPEQLFDGLDARAVDVARLYPESLSKELEHLEGLQQEQSALRAIQRGVARGEGGRIEHRSRSIRRRELPAALAEIDADIVRIRAQLAAHGRVSR